MRLARCIGFVACAFCSCNLALAQGSAPAFAPAILGLNPPQTDPGGSVEIQLARPVVGNVPSIVVGGVAVRGTASDNRNLWWRFEVPAGLTPGSTVPVAVADANGVSDKVDLTIRPLRILSVEPTQAGPGDTVTIVISFAHPLLAEAGVQFADAAPVPARVTASNAIAAIVPASLQTFAQQSVRLTVVLQGVKGVPFDGFAIRGQLASLIPYGVTAAASMVALAGWLLRHRFFKTSLPDPVAVVAPVPTSPAQTLPLDQDPTLFLPPLEVPDEIVRACVTGDCLLYVGAGLGARAGLPTWSSFVADLLKWSIEDGSITPEFGRSLESALATGAGDRVADSVVSAVRQRGRLDGLHDHLRTLFARPLSLPDVHAMLPELGATAVLTTNFDTLIETAFANRAQSLETFVPSDLDKLRSAVAQGRPFLLKLYGDLERPKSLVIAPADYEEKIQVDKPFADFVQELFLTKTILFIGASLNGIEGYLHGLKFRSNPSLRHFAVVGVTQAGWETDADAMARRYGIKVLPYQPSRDHVEVLTFVTELRRRVLAAAAAARTAQPAPHEGGEYRPLIKRLEFNNVGPFEHLALDFKHSWTILLGDNGVGKSTILKSIATAFLGDKAGAAGGRLMRRPRGDAPLENAEIIVTGDGDARYVTDIELNTLSQAEVRQSGAAAFGGKTLVLAFPAVRTIGAKPTATPQPREAAQSPVPADVLPILSEQPDPRILEFKQWFVDLDYLKIRRPQEADRVDAILNGFSDKIVKMLGDVGLGRFEVADNNVFVETRDGRLPLDALSQGTVSILGWVGVLTQRLIEVTGSADGPAVVLIDEIDAHMHPEWQQAIVSRLRQPGAFPNVQFIVSTHSPFLAVGRQKGEIVRVRRDPNTRKALAEPFDRDTSTMTVSDVLTSYLFGLQSQVDHDLQQDVLKLRRLSVKPKLSDEELSEVATLEERLRGVGVASTSADPLYGRFLQELKKVKHVALDALPAQTKEEEAEQLRETQRILAELAAEEDATTEGRP